MTGAGELGRVMAGLPAIAARSVAVLEQLETMTREGLTLSPETIAAMGRAEGRKSRWRPCALDHRGDLYRDPGGRQANVIAMLHNVIALLSNCRSRHGQPDHPKTR